MGKLSPSTACALWMNSLFIMCRPISRTICPDLVAIDLSTGSLYEQLGRRFGLVVASGRRTIEAIDAQSPISGLLKVRKGAALLKTESISYLADGTPFEFYEAWHDGAHSKFELEIAINGRHGAGHAERPGSPFGAVAT